MGHANVDRLGAAGPERREGRRQVSGDWRKPTHLKLVTGNPGKNPLVGTANKAMSDMVRYAAEFGMTPSSRSRVRANLHDDEKDPADQFFAS